ncbi:MAG TPA: DALR domain-containing protein, partial [Coriobacteriia bacterium]
NIIRLLMLQTHYRSSLDFSDSRLDETIHAYERLANLVRNVRWARDLAACGFGVPGESLEGLKAAIAATREKFDADMDDDFNTAGALASVFELARAANTFLARYQVDLCEKDRQVLCEAEDVVVALLHVLGIEIGEGEKAAYPPAVLDVAKETAGYEGTDAEAAVDALLAARAAARTQKDWALADAVRDGLTRLGFHIEDTPQGARVLYKP